MPDESSPPLAASFQALLNAAVIRIEHSLRTLRNRQAGEFFTLLSDTGIPGWTDERKDIWISVLEELDYREQVQAIVEGFHEYCDSCLSTVLRDGKPRYKIEDALYAIQAGRVQLAKLGQPLVPATSVDVLQLNDLMIFLAPIPKV